MSRKRFPLLSLLVLLVALPLQAWDPVGPGVDYQEFRTNGLEAYVARVDLREGKIRVIATTEADKGRRTSDWSKRHDVLVAINADFFDDKHNPIGLAAGACGVWQGTADTKREGVVAVGNGRIEIREQADVMNPVPEWVDHAVSGWPLLVADCEPFSSSRLPGSDAFTRSPHPRTAVGLSGDGRYLYMVVIDGRREGVPGATLSQLATFMRETLGVCRALNLDGGGSSAMVVQGEVRNQPSDGRERWVANHLGVVLAENYRGCVTD